MRNRIIVFMPGMSFSPTRYRLANVTAEHEPEQASLAPAGLIKLQKRLEIADFPDQILALVTAAAREKEAEIRDAFDFDGHRIPVEFVDIPDGENSAELREMMELLLSKVPDDTDLVIDVTHGFRASPLIFHWQCSI